MARNQTMQDRLARMTPQELTRFNEAVRMATEQRRVSRKVGKHAAKLAATIDRSKRVAYGQMTRDKLIEKRDAEVAPAKPLQPRSHRKKSKDPTRAKGMGLVLVPTTKAERESARRELRARLRAETPKPKRKYVRIVSGGLPSTGNRH